MIAGICGFIPRLLHSRAKSRLVGLKQAFESSDFVDAETAIHVRYLLRNFLKTDDVGIAQLRDDTGETLKAANLIDTKAFQMMISVI